jgi:hypothetical protein
MKYDIFVSYRRSDRELVASVVRRLEARGVGVWYDAEIEGGADWREKIVEALTESEMLTIFFSEDSNNSKQLKKELAVADHLGKPVVPILIEDTQPRGAYLYELADRNWIQAYPDPMEKMDELVEHLVTLAGKDGLMGRVVANDVETSKKMAPPAMGSGEFAPPPAAPAASEPAREAEQPLAEAVEEFISGSDAEARPAPKIARAYVGRVSQPGVAWKKRGDILPFRWIDAAILAPLVGLGMLMVWREFSADPPLYQLVSYSFIAIMVIALYGAFVFPVRYYLRRLSLSDALAKYIVSTVILFAALVAIYLVSKAQGVFTDEPGEFLVPAAIAWGAFTLIAFAIYGVLAAHRAIRSFRSNIRKI